MESRWNRFGPAGVLAVLALCGATSAYAAGVSVAVTPGTLTVAPGDTFVVQLTVPLGDDAFNAFEGVVSFDPAFLTFLAQPKATQEGAMMRDSCYTHNTFYIFNSAADSMYISDTMLGNGCTAQGPGTLLNLRFVASGLSGATLVHIRHMVFYNDGLFVDPVAPSDAVIAIRSTLGVTSPPASSGPARLRAMPNPSRGTCWLRPEHVAGTRGILIVDPAGRSVRRLAIDASAAAPTVAWDGRDDAGRLVAPGVYAALMDGTPHPVRTLLIRLP